MRPKALFEIGITHWWSIGLSCYFGKYEQSIYLDILRVRFEINFQYEDKIRIFNNVLF